MPAGRPTTYLPEFCAMLIEHMAKGLGFPEFAGVVGVCEDTVYEWAKVHPEFSEAKKMGKAKEHLFWSQMLRSGAAGQLPNFNATATIFGMKNKFPRHYRDKIQVEASLSEDATKDSLKQLLENPKYRDAALIVAEALAEQKVLDDQSSQGE